MFVTESNSSWKRYFNLKPRIISALSSSSDKPLIVEVNSNEEWLFLTGQSLIDSSCRNSTLVPLNSEQILLADLYVSSFGPCLALESHLRKIKNSLIQKPESLLLARVNCVHVEQLIDFRSESRPTFLFWSLEHGAVGLLRGMNRPLITKLVLEEMSRLSKEEVFSPNRIDFRSESVLQCRGHLASLALDDVVVSIGSGETNKLSTHLFEQTNSFDDVPEIIISLPSHQNTDEEKEKEEEEKNVLSVVRKKKSKKTKETQIEIELLKELLDLKR